MKKLDTRTPFAADLIDVLPQPKPPSHEKLDTLVGTANLAGELKVEQIENTLSIQGTDSADRIIVESLDLNGLPALRITVDDQQPEVFTSIARIKIHAGAGDDLVIVEGNTPAEILGGPGNDSIRGGDAMDFIYGGDGDDVIEGGMGDDYIYGGSGDDKLFGGDGDDRIRAEAGNDLLDGGSGDDWLRGGYGQDLLFGGDGDDSLEAFDKN